MRDRWLSFGQRGLFPSRRIGAIAVAAVLPTLALVACEPRVAPPGPAECAGCNVVLLLADTLRADHLGVYGYARETSPNIDAFAADAIVGVGNRAQAACTFPSVNSILTSRFPASFMGQGEVEGEKQKGIPEGIPSIAEILSDAGYRTIAESGSPTWAPTPDSIRSEATRATRICSDAWTIAGRTSPSGSWSVGSDL